MGACGPRILCAVQAPVGAIGAVHVRQERGFQRGVVSSSANGPRAVRLYLRPIVSVPVM